MPSCSRWSNASWNEVRELRKKGSLTLTANIIRNQALFLLLAIDGRRRRRSLSISILDCEGAERLQSSQRESEKQDNEKTEKQTSKIEHNHWSFPQVLLPPDSFLLCSFCLRTNSFEMQGSMFKSKGEVSKTRSTLAC